MTILRANGWAVVQNNRIDPATVYGTRRGAIVNWLVTQGYFVSSAMSDDIIERIWSLQENTPLFERAQVIMVSIVGRAENAVG